MKWVIKISAFYLFWCWPLQTIMPPCLCLQTIAHPVEHFHMFSTNYSICNLLLKLILKPNISEKFYLKILQMSDHPSPWLASLGLWQLSASHWFPWYQISYGYLPSNNWPFKDIMTVLLSLFHFLWWKKLLRFTTANFLLHWLTNRYGVWGWNRSSC